MVIRRWNSRRSWIILQLRIPSNTTHSCVEVLDTVPLATTIEDANLMIEEVDDLVTVE